MTEWAQTFRDAKPVDSPLSAAGLRAGVRNLWLRVAGALRPDDNRPSLRCLYCHYVYDDQLASFGDLMQRLSKLGTFVSSAELKTMLEKALPLNRRYFHLSFDDGLDNLHRNAFPLLQQHKLPATVFVASKLVANDASTPSGWSPNGSALRTRVADWGMLREMSAAGIEIGSHTRTHVDISSIASDHRRLTDEIEGSKHEIEDRLGVACRYFAWPYGRGNEAGAPALQIVAQAGYDLCFHTRRGAVQPGKTAPLDVPRHHFEAEWPWLHLRYFANGGREK